MGGPDWLSISRFALSPPIGTEIEPERVKGSDVTPNPSILSLHLAAPFCIRIPTELHQARQGCG